MDYKLEYNTFIEITEDLLPVIDKCENEHDITGIGEHLKQKKVVGVAVTINGELIGIFFVNFSEDKKTLMMLWPLSLKNKLDFSEVIDRYCVAIAERERCEKIRIGCKRYATAKLCEKKDYEMVEIIMEKSI
jgi:hypothetical protein